MAGCFCEFYGPTPGKVSDKLRFVLGGQKELIAKTGDKLKFVGHRGGSHHDGATRTAVTACPR